jgi:UDP-GlcNAc:undecaprenyl-phosphate/decaprenyl-phosphate GlcNAc-1-phosphate transferase
MGYLLLFFLVNYVLSLALSSYAVKKANVLGIKKEAYKERIKLHRHQIPRLGGIVLGANFLIASVFYFFYTFDELWLIVKLSGVFVASTLLLFCGIYDDLIKRLRYKIKFILQVLAVIILVGFGYNLQYILWPFHKLLYINGFSILFIACCVIIMVNAMNLLDGLDGLSCGIAVIMLSGFLIAGLHTGNRFLILFSVALIGGCLGFLRYNFYPAKIFLGDSGSYLLGFVLGVMGLELLNKNSGPTSAVVPLLILFIPVVSLIFTFSRRIAFAKNPFKPDRMHLHYNLLRAGIKHKNVVLLFYAITAIYVVLGVFLLFISKKFYMELLILAAIIAWQFYIWSLCYINFIKRKRMKTREKLKKVKYAGFHKK